MGEFTIEDLNGMRGETVYDREGEKIGKIDEIFYDEGSNRPEWVGVGSGFFGMKRVLVPLAGARRTDDGLTVACSKAEVEESPDVQGDELDDHVETTLASHYSGAKEESVVRSEEELRVGKRTVEAGGVRLRKWVETEPAEVDVELRRETAHVTREAIDERVSGADFSEEEMEVPLHAEEAVVQKDVVAKERVSVEKGTTTERETVKDELRKERVEVDGADER